MLQAQPLFAFGLINSSLIRRLYQVLHKSSACVRCLFKPFLIDSILFRTRYTVSKPYCLRMIILSVRNMHLAQRCLASTLVYNALVPKLEASPLFALDAKAMGQRP